MTKLFLLFFTITNNGAVNNFAHKPVCIGASKLSGLIPGRGSAVSKEYVHW